MVIILVGIPNMLLPHDLGVYYQNLFLSVDTPQRAIILLVVNGSPFNRCWKLVVLKNIATIFDIKPFFLTKMIS